MTMQQATPTAIDIKQVVASDPDFLRPLWHLLDGVGADKMTWLERKLQTLESEMHAARTAGELKVAIKYYMQVKAAVARERAAAAAGDRAPE